MNFLRQIVLSFSQAVKQCLRQWTQPDNHTLVLNTVLDLTRSKSELLLEIALLRQQLIILQRQTKRPKLTVFTNYLMLRSLWLWHLLSTDRIDCACQMWVFWR
jgi:hypothetical protein